MKVKKAAAVVEEVLFRLSLFSRISITVDVPRYRVQYATPWTTAGPCVAWCGADALRVLAPVAAVLAHVCEDAPSMAGKRTVRKRALP